ncbi:MAG: DUF1223 domain-containing protein [Paracoccaceae bacterium]
MNALRHFFTYAVLAWGLFAGAVQAQSSPVVVELFTSQGCSSCPPADALLHELAKRDDVIALALHVDYWDYIGWKDQFADPAHSERQRAYAVTAGRRSIYTPQMIVNGQTSVVGARAMELSDAIAAHRAKESSVTLEIERVADTVSIRARSDARVPDGMVVHVLRYQTARDIQILRGENAGRQMTYANVVEDWRVWTEWTGQSPLVTSVDVDGDAPVVVIVQGADQGPILAAAQLR